MNKWDYELSELLPVVTKLVEEYTRKESTSITYETAQKLMEAVEYCIYENKLTERDKNSEQNVLEETTQSIVELKCRNARLTAMDAYKRGYQIVIKKVDQVRVIYNEMSENFDSYGNKNYRATVMRGIPGFLTHYDAKYQPQDQILTMDYPALGAMEEDCGVNIILSYIQKIKWEQDFLNEFPKICVEEILYNYHSDYKNMFFNICAPVLRFTLVCSLLKRPISTYGFSEKEFEQLSDIVLSCTRIQLKKVFEDTLERLCMNFEDSQRMYYYLSSDLGDFISELRNASNHQCIEAVFHQC